MRPANTSLADSSPDRELRNQGFHSVVCTLVRCENPSCSLCLPQEFVQLERPGPEERPPIMSEVKVTITSNARKNAHTKFSFNLHCNFLLPPSTPPLPNGNFSYGQLRISNLSHSYYYEDILNLVYNCFYLLLAHLF